MDALGLFSSGLFSGYSIIWAGGGDLSLGGSLSAANGSFLIIASAIGGSVSSIIMSGFMIIANGKSAYYGGFGYYGDTSLGYGTGTVGITYSGSTISCIGNTTLSFSGFIIA